MTKISIIVPVYKVENYLPYCLDSLINQSLQEIEVICINDASPDSSGMILDEYQKKSSLIKVINLPQNEGTLRARLHGVNVAQGKYIMFVDSDDYLECNTCRELYEHMEKLKVDVLHFGTVLHAGTNVSAEMFNWVTQFLKPYAGRLDSQKLADACFVQDKFDFNITNKIWSSDICKKAFSHVELVRLIASEDRYVFFLLMYYARSYYGIEEKFYHYNIGVGVTGGDILSLEQFEKRCSGALASEMVKRFLDNVEDKQEYLVAAESFADKILYDCVDCWHNKLEEKDYQEGFQILQRFFGNSRIMNAIAALYFEQGKDIIKRARLSGGKRIAIYYRYLGKSIMDREIREYVSRLMELGNHVVIYTDRDRKSEVQDSEYNAEIVFLPDSKDANWDKYRKRGEVFYSRLKEDGIDVLIYASPTSHIYQMDSILTTLAGVTVVDMKSEIYLNGMSGDDGIIKRVKKISLGLLKRMVRVYLD